MNETMPMVTQEFLSRQDLRPITIRCVNPQPPKIVIPGLRLSQSFALTRLVVAMFTELSGDARQIPPEADRVLLQPSSQQRTSAAYFEGSNTFILPAIGAEGGTVRGREPELIDGRELEILNCTARGHEIKSPAGGLVNGVGGVITLNGVGANVKLRAVRGVWIITSAYMAKLQ
jgi:hypothetical protein